MQVEWDDGKRQRLLRERGLDLLYAALIFDGPVLTWEDDRQDYGERRWISLDWSTARPSSSSIPTATA